MISTRKNATLALAAGSELPARGQSTDRGVIMGECVYAVEMTGQPCNLQLGDLIRIACNGACDEWIFYDDAACSGGAFASIYQDNCGSSLAPLATLTTPSQPRAGLKVTGDRQAARVALQGLKEAATILGEGVNRSQNMDQLAEPLLAALQTVLASTQFSVQGQQIVVTAAWRARNLATSQNASAAVAKIEAHLNDWKAADPTSTLGRLAEEALMRVEAAPDRAGCSVVDKTRVISIRKP